MDLHNGLMINGVMMKTTMLPATLMVVLVVIITSLAGIITVTLVHALKMHQLQSHLHQHQHLSHQHLNHQRLDLHLHQLVVVSINFMNFALNIYALKHHEDTRKRITFLDSIILTFIKIVSKFCHSARKK